MSMTREKALETIAVVLQHTETDCDYAYDNADGSLDLLSGQDIADALRLALAALREQAERRWIPVTERLPKPFESVLAYIPSEAPLPTVHESYIADHDEWVCILTVERYKPGEVTHWMPLPEPPKEGT